MQLMRRAASGATRVLLRRISDGAARVHVFTGPGNNGGDGWLVAAELSRAGHRVRVTEVEESRTEDARLARTEALPFVSLGPPESPTDEPPTLVVDAILGTGSRGAPRGAVAAGVAAITALQELGATVAALDVPTGLDATTGDAASSVRADLTISFASAKRGQLISRTRCGELVVVDIGISDFVERIPGSAPLLVDSEWVHQRLPRIDAEAHKGTRRRVLMVGGTRGMAGAIALAARAALRSGVGMVRVCVERESVAPLQSSVVEATAVPWPDDDVELPDTLLRWPDALLIGPGFGDDTGARRRAERWLRDWRGPVVVDADALNVFAGDAESLGALLAGRPAVVTPHPAELARLAGIDVRAVLDQRFEIGRAMARTLRAVVLLKGVPTNISAENGDTLVSAAGTPVLATAGSGDLLAGIVATLVAQSDDPLVAAACGAWVHGKAGEIANAGRPIRGVTLADVVDALAHAWRSDRVAEIDGVLAHLPMVGEA
jgi:ADP-dependent NAD(P)H-hydrate dehydratase / NAD(P)H-hydrate epimerase